ncbi:extracellular solute-binding protein [Desertihabitans brevis]|uniref:Extracellular solute-binding protein n=1 Tax=Desertihabitans brevis TaxID=2268447 RepID=A0A367YWU3_9ACTN|nr:extracellular solute-binding protein [Desertihabitans brevis]RCK70207.1 extracellular solute-binding protein [Desertihabitans brevis]
MDLPRRTTLSRRTLLGAGALGGALLATGCQIDTGTGTPEGPAPADQISFPDYPGTPTGDVTFRWVDSGDLKSVFIEAVLDAYTAKHPNVTTSYDGGGWEQVAQVVPLGIRNGSAHDVFALPLEQPAQVAINEGWVRPLDDIVPDFETWKAAFPATTFIPGVHVFDGKTYTFPLNSVRRLDRMLFFDTEVMSAAGYDDPVAQIRTWDDMRAAARAVTETGPAGLMAGGDNLSNLVSFLAMSAGWRAPASGMDMSTGEYIFDAEEMVQAVELLQSMVADGSVVPGFLTLNEKDARAQMPSGVAGMILNGPWDIPAWQRAAPDWSYAMATMPSPDGAEFVVPYQETGANSTWVYADTPNPEVAGQLAAYMGSVAGQAAMVALSGGNLVSTIEQANTDADQPGLLDENARRAADLARQVMRAVPQVQLRNPDAGMVQLEVQPVQPGLSQVLQGVFSGELTDVSGELGRYNAAMNAALDDAIAAAAAKGSTVTREDYVFENWDPTRDYTAADYEALG